MEEREPQGDNETPDGRGSVAALRDRMRSAIVSGEIPASAARTQAQLAHAFGVSRTPLREALRMLEREDLIIREANGRFRAASLSPDEIEQFGIMRITLESVAASLTAPGLTSRDHAKLEGVYAESVRLADAGRWAEFDQCHHEFHLLLTSAVGPLYRALLMRLSEQETRYRRASQYSSGGGGGDCEHAEHRAILDAARSGDGEATASLIVQHHANTARTIAASLYPDHPMTGLALALDLENAAGSPPANLQVKLGQ
jgi:DNA-binding GntR family transcriptional regulator